MTEPWRWCSPPRARVTAGANLCWSTQHRRGYLASTITWSTTGARTPSGHRAGLEPRFCGVSRSYAQRTSTSSSCTTRSRRSSLSLEGYGFCGRYEAADFVKGGTLGPGGHLPFNTAGGSLSEAYIHGMNLVVKGCAR